MHRRSIGLIVGLIVLSPVTASAGLVWTGDWTITKLTADAGGVGGASSAFGASSTMNGEVNDLKADSAVAKVSAGSLSDVMRDSASEAAVEFQRDFQLTGSPAGWIATLSGILTGSLDANSPEKNVRSISSVLATAYIEDAAGQILFRIGGGGTTWNRSITAEDNKKTLPVMQPQFATAVLPDGNYTIFGILETSTTAEAAPLAAGSANANFFPGLTVSLAAKAVPEPSTLALGGLGVATGLAALARRRRTGIGA